MKKFFLIVSALSLSFICSCTSTTIYLKLQPSDENAVFLGGKQIVEKEYNDIQIKLSYDDADRYYYLFSLEIINKSNQDILIDPEQICYEIKSDFKDKLVQAQINKYFKTTYAMDPELLINKLQNEINHTKSNYSESKSVDAAFGLLDFVDDVSTMHKRTREEKKQRWKDREEEQENDRKQYEWYEKQIAKKTIEKRQLETYSFRKSILTPQKTIKGIIYLPKIKYSNIEYSTYDIITISIPIEGQNIDFNYSVIRTVVKR